MEIRRALLINFQNIDFFSKNETLLKKKKLLNICNSDI